MKEGDIVKMGRTGTTRWLITGGGPDKGFNLRKVTRMGMSVTRFAVPASQLTELPQ